MSRNALSGRRIATAFGALAAAVATTAALAAPAGAASGKGTAVISLAQHAKGRTLSGQGVAVLAEAPATQEGRKLTLPVSEVDPGAKPSTNAGGNLRFKKGKRSLLLSALRFDLAAGTLTGTAAGSEVPVFKLGAAPSVNGTTGAVGLSEGQLRLTSEAAELLRDELGLERALVHKGVGMAWLSAKANPTHAASRAVVAGGANWGVLASWRKYVLGNFGPGSVGTITAEGGTAATGNLAESSSFFSFPAASGSYRKGLYGAADTLALKTQGSVKFAKPGHCIIEVKMSELELTIDGANSSIATNGKYDIDKVSGMSCLDEPAVSLPGLTLATLDPSGIVPTYSADGKTVTWTGIPAKLTAAATAMFGGQYPAGKELDLVTVAVTVG